VCDIRKGEAVVNRHVIPVKDLLKNPLGNLVGKSFKNDHNCSFKNKCKKTFLKRP